MSLNPERQHDSDKTHYADLDTLATLARLERENADLRAEIKAHNDGCAAACKARHEGGACAYRNADGSPRYGNKRCHDCPQEYAIDAAIAAGKGEK